MRIPARTLLLPGWQNSDAAHWQSRWQALHGFERLEQDDWLWPRRGDWMARLEETVRESERPLRLVAHSLGCHLVAAWAAHTQLAARVQGALLVAPPDLERADLPPQLHNWRSTLPGRTHARLPFRSVLAASSDDPFCAIERAGSLAAAWGAELVVCGARGHLNSASGLGDWPEGLALLEQIETAD
ncbi:MAG: serine hydrolase family protein [Pelomonas sp.]|nr:serine hydrolase family protein [Roseateles sp.]